MDAKFRHAVAAARREGGLFFAGLLSEDRILQAFGEARWKWQGCSIADAGKRSFI